MKQLAKRLWREEEGQDLTEYALLMTLIALACLAAINGLSGAIQNAFTNVSSNMT